MIKFTKLCNMAMIASLVLSPFPVINGEEVRNMLCPDEITTEKKVVKVSDVVIDDEKIEKDEGMEL